MIVVQISDAHVPNRLLKNGFNSLLKQAKDGLPENKAS